MRWIVLGPVILAAVLAGALAIPAGAAASCPSFRMPPPVLIGFWVAPRHGRAPLQVRMGWWVFPVADPTDMDFEVDGVVLAPDDRSWPQPAHVFTQPGRHSVAGYVTDRGGRTVTRAVSVEVESAAAFDAEVSRRWAAFKSAMAHGDVDRALECVTSATRDRARAALTSGRPFAASLARYGDTLTFVGTVSSFDLEYRTDFVDGRAQTFVLSPDVDDVWRLDANGWPL